MMRYTLFITAAVAIMLGACSPKSSAPAGEKNYDSLGPVVSAYLPAREGPEQYWGMVRTDGTMLFSDKFPGRPAATVNGYFTAPNEQGTIDVWRADTVPVKIASLSGLKYAGAMAYELMPVTRKGKRIELVDCDGNAAMAMPAIDGREIVKCAPYFVDGLLSIYTQDGKWGAINTRGELVVDAVYDSEPRFSERVASVSRQRTELADSATTRTITDYYLINSSGRVIFTFPRGMKPCSVMKGGRIIVEMPDGSLSAMTESGSLTALPREAKKVAAFGRDYIIYKAGDRCGLLDGNMRTILQPAYRSIAALDSSRYLVEASRGVYSVVDAEGRTRTNFNGFDSIRAISNIAPAVTSPFHLLGFGNNGIVLQDYHGRIEGGRCFAEVDTRVTLLDDGYVHTDFFNTQNSLHALLSPVSTSGWGRATLGASLVELADSVTDSLTDVRALRVVRESHYMLDLDVVAYSDRTPAMEEDTEEGRIVRSNTEAKIRYVRVEASVPGRRFGEMLHNVGAELVPRGYRAERIRDEYAVYVSPDSYIILTPRPGLQGLYLYLLDKDMYSSASERIISDGEAMFRKAVSQ